jgi:hypothetical protein
MRRLIAFLIIGCFATASADDILLQVGGRFSIYEPSALRAVVDEFDPA